MRSCRWALACVLFLGTSCARVFSPPAVSAPEKAEQSPAYASLNAKIAFWEKRLPYDPEDNTAANRLAAAYLAKARKSGDFSFYIKAEKVLEPLITRSGSDYSTFILLASAKAAQHKFREAAEFAQSARAILPSDATSYALLFDAKLELGDLKEAESYLLKLKELDPGFAMLTREANLRLIKGDLDGAISSLKSALADAESRDLSADDIAWCHVRLGAVYFDHGRFDLAEQNYLAALKLTPDGHLPLEHLAELRAAKGEHAEALKLYNQVVKLAPYPEFLEALGSVHEANADQAAADEWYIKAEQSALQQLSSGDMGVYRYLAEFYSDVRPNSSEALRYARADLEVRQDIHTYSTFAWALYRAGMFSEASVTMEKALSTGVQEASTFCHAAAISDAVKDNKRASFYREKALHVNPRLTSKDCP